MTLLGPELALLSGSLILLLLGTFRPAPIFALVVSAGAVGAATWLLWVAPFGADTLMSFGPDERILGGMLLFFTAVALFGSWEYLPTGGRDGRSGPRGGGGGPYEFYGFTLLSALFMLLLLKGGDFLFLFFTVEGFSFCLYLLTAFGGGRRNLEGALKYFLVGGAASAFFLLGLAFYFAGTGGTGMRPDLLSSPVVQISFVLFVSVLFFKLALFPFYVWVPDVYTAAPLPATAFMAVAVKIAVFAVAFDLLHGQLLPTWFIAFLWVLAVMTQTVGNLSALAQSNAKRMLAYSSVAHAGYLAVALVTGEAGREAAYFYLGAYGLMTMLSFLALVPLAGPEDQGLELSALRGFARVRVFLGVALSVGMFSLIGLPPFVGFFGKYYLFFAALKEGYRTLVLLSLLNSVISAGYYLRLLTVGFMEERRTDEPAAPVGPVLTATLALLALLTLFVGLIPHVAR